jgi:eukaryotic-like serine/threonine-protein kinase
MDNKLLGSRYELMEEIGVGGMARVYKARCTLLNRFVAVKILKDEFAQDPDFLKRFKYEAQAAAGLSHQNIVSIYDVGTDGDQNYIVMEYVDGITLKKYLKDNAPLPEKEVLRIASQVCKALILAHKNGVVHRDIKPHNIIIDEDGTIKVADFGIARAASSSTITLAGNTVGSVHYFSPEQARGLPTDAKSDLYSLGATMYELITGKLLFDASTPIAIALKHVQEEPVPPVNINPATSYNLNNLIMRLLAKNPSDRFESAQELLKHIEKIQSQPYKKNIEMKAESDTVAIKPEDHIFMRKRKRRRETKDVTTTIIAVFVSMIAVALFAYLVFGIIIPSLDLAAEKVGEITIENYVGAKIEDVTKILDSHKIEIIKDEVYDENIKAGEVIAQSISPNSTLKEGAKITLTVSLGPEYVTFKDYTFTDYREALKELRDLGLKPVIKTEYNEDVDNGLVISTDPVSGTKVRLGTEIKVTRSLGKEILYVFVPDLSNLTYDEAVGKIEANGLILDLAVNYGKEGYSDIVSSQSPTKDRKVPEGTKVTIFFDKLSPVTQTETQTGTDGTSVTETTVTTGTTEPTSSADADFVYIEQSISIDTTALPDPFSFAVETKTSLEDLYALHFIGSINKSDIPYVFVLKIPKGGYADIRVYVMGEFLKEIHVADPGGQ